MSSPARWPPRRDRLGADGGGAPAAELEEMPTDDVDSGGTGRRWRTRPSRRSKLPGPLGDLPEPGAGAHLGESRSTPTSDINATQFPTDAEPRSSKDRRRRARSRCGRDPGAPGRTTARRGRPHPPPPEAGAKKPTEPVELAGAATRRRHHADQGRPRRRPADGGPAEKASVIRGRDRRPQAGAPRAQGVGLRRDTAAPQEGARSPPRLVRSTPTRKPRHWPPHRGGQVRHRVAIGAGAAAWCIARRIASPAHRRDPVAHPHPSNPHHDELPRRDARREPASITRTSCASLDFGQSRTGSSTS